MKVAAFQFDVRRGETDANLATVEAGLRRAADAGVHLVVLPEMWPTSFVAPGGTSARELEHSIADAERAVERIRVLSAELELVVAGSALASAGARRAPFNRLHLFDRGEPCSTYDKVHLFSPTAETEAFTAGEAPAAVAATSAGCIGGVICYDLRFGPLVATAFDAGVEVLVAPAQWPELRATHWRALALGRAVENQCFLIATNRTGVERVGRRQLELAFPGNSLVVDPGGRVLAEGRGEAGLVMAEIELDEVRRMRVRVPVAKDRRLELYQRWATDAAATR